MTERDALVHFGAVADAEDSESLAEAQKVTHDRVVRDLGDRRVSPVEWAIYDATEGPRLLKIAGLREHPEAEGLLRFLRNNPKGLLVIAKAEYESPLPKATE